MIYDPRRRALELRQRIIESMTSEEREEYARLHPPEPTDGEQAPDTSPTDSVKRGTLPEH